LTILLPHGVCPMRITLCALLLTLSPSVGFADDEPDLKKAPAHLHGMTYRLVGPYAGGRVSRACGVAGDPLTYYAATASGGVWKSSDGGLNWKSIFDDQPTSSIGSIAVAPSDSNVVYVGTGEANIRGNVSPGAGIFVSTDAGKTWTHSWQQVGQIGMMAVNPRNSDIAFAAVLGHAFGPNPERGVYRTLDGGKSWQRVLFKNNDTGCSDVAIDPNNPRIIFAGFWQTRRRPWDLTSGGPGSDLYISRDGGDTWTSLKKDTKKSGLPSGDWGKVGVAVSPANSSRVYALIEAEKGGLFRSDDGGETWTNINSERVLRQRAWYYSTITVHPTNADVLYCPQVPMLKSIDGGKSFQSVRGIHHGDHHDLWFDPANPNRMISANDGGVDISTDGGKTWYAPPLPITQFYHVSADNRFPYHIMGNMQDLGTASGPSNSLKFSGIGMGDWYTVGGGETGFSVSDPADPNIVYSGEYGGILTRYDHRTRQSRNISAAQYNPSGIDPSKHPYRFQWTAPLLISPHDSKTIYHGANVLLRTKDAGQTWEKISGDLTRNDKQKQGWSGGPITGDNTGAETYCTIFAIAESTKQKGLLWAGSDDGLVHVSKDDGKTWENVTANVPDLPDWGTVECIEPSPHDAGTAYLVVDAHRMDDYRPYIWNTTDFGKTWTKLTGDLDDEVHVNVVREDPKKKGLLYLGTERGIRFSTDAGKSWLPLQLNLPTVPVHDLVLKGDDLVVGTHGRSLWILDDLTPLREWDAKQGETPAYLYPIRPTVKWLGNNGDAARFARIGGKNPDAGAVAWFQLPKLPKEDVTIRVADKAGKLVCEAKGKTDAKDDDKDDEDDDKDPPKREFKIKAGLNRFVWDVTYDGAEFIPGAKVDAGFPGMTIPAAPGEYTLELIVGKQSYKQPVIVRPDPRARPLPKTDSRITQSIEELRNAVRSDSQARSEQAVERLVRDYQNIVLEGNETGLAANGNATPEQVTLALKIRDDITKLTQTVLRLRAILKQINLRKELLKGQVDAKDLLKESEAFARKLNELEEKLHNPKAKVVYDVFGPRGGAMLYSQFTWLLGNVADGEGPPTKAQQDYAVELDKRLTGYVEEFGKLTGDDMKKLNEAAKKLGVPELYVPPVKKAEEKMVEKKVD
jgi:photosystem II stability/assembly factor-like uncharacterized protein